MPSDALDPNTPAVPAELVRLESPHQAGTDQRSSNQLPSPFGTPGGGAVSKTAIVNTGVSVADLGGRTAAQSDAAYASIDPNDVGFDIVVAIGQSNMSGRATPIDLNVDYTDARVLQFATTGTYAGVTSLAIEPLGHDDAPTGLGPAGAFAKFYAQVTGQNRKVLIVPMGHGNTGFTASSTGWLASYTGGLVDKTVTRVQSALTQGGGTNRVVAAIWSQGEYDGDLSVAGSTYQTNLLALIAALRSRLGVSDLPFVVGQIVPDYLPNAGRGAINDVHTAIGTLTTRAAFAPGIFGSTNGDGLHYGLTAQRAMGRSMFDAYRRIVKSVADPTLPSKPTATTVTTGTVTATSVVLNWTASTGAVQYYVEQSPSGANTWTRIGTPNGLTATVSGLTSSTAYDFRVTPNNLTGPGARSTVVTATTSASGADITAPTISTFTATAGNTQNVLGWSGTDNVGITRWTVVRGGTTVYDGTATTVTDTGLTNGTAYTYTLTAYDAAGNTTTASVTATPSATGSAFVSDAFTDTAGTLLTAHTGATGATWTVSPTVTAGTMAITAANRLRQNNSSPSLFYASGTPASANYTVEADFAVATAAGATVAICARVSTTVTTLYMLRLTPSTGVWDLVKFVSGTSTTLGSYTQTITAGQTVHAKLVVNGTAISGVIDGTTQITATDSSVTTAGKAGVYSGSGGGVTDSVGVHLDNLTAA